MTGDGAISKRQLAIAPDALTVGQDLFCRGRRVDTERTAGGVGDDLLALALGYQQRQVFSFLEGIHPRVDGHAVAVDILRIETASGGMEKSWVTSTANGHKPDRIVLDRTVILGSDDHTPVVLTLTSARVTVDADVAGRPSS